MDIPIIAPLLDFHIPYFSFANTFCHIIYQSIGHLGIEDVENLSWHNCSVVNLDKLIIMGVAIVVLVEK